MKTCYLSTPLVLCRRILQISKVTLNMAKRLLRLFIAAGMLWISARNQSISQISWHNSTCELRSKLRWEIPAAAYMKAEITLAGEVNLSFTAQSGRASSTAFFFTRKVDRALGKLRYTIRWNSNRTFILTEQSGKVLLENSSSVKNSHVFYVASASKNYITFQSKTAGKFLMADAQGVIGLTSNSHVATYFKMRC